MIIHGSKKRNERFESVPSRSAFKRAASAIRRVLTKKKIQILREIIQPKEKCGFRERDRLVNELKSFPNVARNLSLLLFDEDENVRINAANALSIANVTRLGKRYEIFDVRPVISSLGQALFDPSYEVRCNAVKALDLAAHYGIDISAAEKGLLLCIEREDKMARLSHVEGRGFGATTALARHYFNQKNIGRVLEFLDSEDSRLKRGVLSMFHNVTEGQPLELMDPYLEKLEKLKGLGDSGVGGIFYHIESRKKEGAFKMASRWLEEQAAVDEQHKSKK